MNQTPSVGGLWIISRTYNTLKLFCLICLFSEQFKKMYVQKVKEQEKAYNKQVCTQRLKKTVIYFECLVC